MGGSTLVTIAMVAMMLVMMGGMVAGRPLSDAAARAA
jgi:hypothetical protein